MASQWALNIKLETDNEYFLRFVKHPLLVTVRFDWSATEYEVYRYVHQYLTINAECSVYRHEGTVVVILVANRWPLRHNCSYHGLKVTVAHISIQDPDWEEGAIGQMWRMRNATQIFASKGFSELSPISEWIEELPGDGLVPLKPLPRNPVSLTFTKSLKIPCDVANAEQTAFFCVEKETRRDLWISPHHRGWTVLNAGFLVRETYLEMRAWFARTGHPPQQRYEFVECDFHRVPEDTFKHIILGLMPYAMPTWDASCERVLTTMCFAGYFKTVTSTVVLTSLICRKNYRRLTQKLAFYAKHYRDALTNKRIGVVGICYRCKRERGMYPCYGRRCSAVCCQSCVLDPTGTFTRCGCGRLLTLAWWKLVNSERDPFFTFTVYGDDCPESLFNQCLLKANSLKLHERYPEGTIPAHILPSVRARQWQIEYGMD